MSFNLNSASGDIEKIRAQLKELKDENSWIETALRPKKELIEANHRLVDERASESKFARYILADMNPFPVGFTPKGMVDIAPLLCDLFNDEIKAKISEKINAADYEQGPVGSEKESIMADNLSSIFDLETKEESLIVQAEACGMLIHRRPDADLRVVLEWVD